MKLKSRKCGAWRSRGKSGRLRLAASGVFASVCIAAAAVTTTGPDSLSPLARGYYDRAVGMLATGNYAGVIDQLEELAAEASGLSIDERNECSYLLAMALYERGDSECVALLQKFAAANPASQLGVEARLAAADYFFFAHQWPAALSAYVDMDYSLIPPARQPLYEYRKSLSMLRCGMIDEAVPLLRGLESRSEFAVPARYYLAYVDYVKGDYDKAYREFEAVADEISSTPLEGRTTGVGQYESSGIEPGYYMAQIEYSHGDYDSAIAHGRALLQKKPVEELVPEINRVVGLSYFKTGQYSVAKSFLTDYVDTPDLQAADDAEYALGVIDYSEGKYQQAANRFGELTDRHNDLAQSAYLYLGQIAVKEGDANAAALAFEKASKMNYDANVSEAALYNYIAARTRGGNIPFSSSIPMFESFLKRFPNSRYAKDAEQYLAMAYYNEKDYANALKTLQRIKNPDAEVREAMQKANYQLGVEAVTNGNPAAAVTPLREASSSGAPDSRLAARSALWLGDAYYALEDWSKAGKAYEEFINAASSRSRGAELKADLPLAQYNLGYTLMKQGKYGAAADIFSSLVKGSALPQTLASDARIRLADCQYYTGDYRSARINYSTAVDDGGADADYAYYRSAVMLGLAGDIDGKIKQLNQLSSRYPNSRWAAAAMLEKGRSFAALGRSQEATRAFEELRSTHKTSPEARKGMLSLAISYMDNGQPEKAEAVYREILTTWPSSEEASLANEDLRRFYAQRGELPAYAQFLNSIPNAPRLDADEIERLQFDAAETAWSDNEPGAEAKLEDYAARYPNGRYLPQVLLHLAESAADDGDPDKGIAYLDMLLSRRSDSPEAPEALLMKGEILEETGARPGALEAYKMLEKIGGTDMAAEACAGIMRTTDNSSERLRYARQVKSLGGVSAEEAADAEFYEAEAMLGGHDAADAEQRLAELAKNPVTLAGAKSAVALGEHYLATGSPRQAIKVLTEFTDAGSPHSYWLARGFIALADANHAIGKTYLAKEYLKSLQENYPGTELDIHDMISSRLSKWKN